MLHPLPGGISGLSTAPFCAIINDVCIIAYCRTGGKSVDQRRRHRQNEGERLAACLKSIQTALNVLAHEVVYVDSCSTDQSLQTAKALGARCFLLAERQTTAGLGRFVGAKEARGEYLLFLDGDMQLCPGFAEKR